MSLGKLCEDEQKLFECINSGKHDEVKTLLGQPGVRVDCLDETGMTPLQQAAFKGADAVCQLLLAHGADVNSNYHQHGYTALMFAALSGKTNVTQTILEAGANVSVENGVHRTASQMAAFVGQHQCVSVINNFFSKCDLEYYCIPQGLETEPKLPPSLCSLLYKLIVSHNLNPIRMSMVIQSSPELMECKKTQKVLDLLVEKMMKQKETNEVMAFKFHYLSTLVKECAKWKADKDDNLDGWIKRLCRGRDSDGCQEFTENFIRSVIKTFPYVESQLFQQMVRTVAAVTIGDSPSALSVLGSGVNGQRFASEEDKLCNLCGAFQAQKKCSACKAVNYCEQKCQRLDWPTHKKLCQKMKDEQIQIDKQKKEEEEKLQKEKEEKRMDEVIPNGSTESINTTDVDSVVSDVKQSTESIESTNSSVAEKPED